MFSNGCKYSNNRRSRHIAACNLTHRAFSIVDFASQAFESSETPVFIGDCAMSQPAI